MRTRSITEELKLQLFDLPFTLPAPLLATIFGSLKFKEIVGLVDFTMLSNATLRHLWHAQIKGILRCSDMDNRRYSKNALRWVLKRGITISNFTTRDLKFGATELHYASRNDKARIARACIAFNDDDVNAPNDHGWTPLHLACHHGHVKMAKLLLKSGAQPSLCHKSGKGHIPISLAIQKENIDTVKLLLTYHEQDKERSLQNFGNAIRQAARVGNIEIIKLLASSLGPDLMHSRSSRNNTVLHGASYFNNAEVIELLLELGADVESVGRKGATPLSNAAKHICPDSARALLAAGAAVNHVDERGRTPLDLAHYMHDVHPDKVESRLHLFDELVKVLEDVGGVRAAQLAVVQLD